MTQLPQKSRGVVGDFSSLAVESPGGIGPVTRTSAGPSTPHCLNNWPKDSCVHVTILDTSFEPAGSMAF